MKKINYLSVLFFSWVFLASAQTQNSESKTSKIPILNGHRFQSSNLHRSAFLSTNLQTDIGYGKTSLLNIPGITIGDYELFNFQGKLLYVDIKVQYQQQFNPWFSLFTTIKISNRLGIDMSTILVDGINTISGGDIGTLIKLRETEKFYLSGLVKINNLRGNFINVTDYVEEIIDGEPYPSAIKKIPSTTVQAGLRAAYAFNPTYGLQVNTDYSYGESMHRDVTKGNFLFGIIGDIDFKPKYDVPVAFALGYTLTSSPDVSIKKEGNSNLFSGKIGYTGSDEFELGLQLTHYQLRLEEDDNNVKNTINKIILNLKFYF